MGSTAPPDYAAATQQMSSGLSVDLVVAAQREADFLRMIDRKGSLLYEPDVVNQAIRRYETFWLPMQARNPDVNVIPPLDVYWIWHTHMLCPTSYQEDCERLVGHVIDHRLFSLGGIQKRYKASVRTWDSYCSPEPYNVLASPAPAPTYVSQCKYDIASAVQRQRNFNYQVSLPHYTSKKFLTEAVECYVKFLLLNQTYHGQPLTPCYAVDFIWHAHQVHPLNYQRDCTAIFGGLLKHDDSVDDRAKRSKLLKAEALTKKLWQTHFDQPFWKHGCMFRGHNAPSFMGFENQDLNHIACGEIHVSSIVLKDIPVQREQLRLKLCYGNKKVTTLNEDLSQKQVTKSGFSLVWQLTDSSTSASIVKFPFERKAAKKLVVKLEVFDKSYFFLRKGLIRLIGKVSLDQLLSLQNSKTAHNVAEVQLRTKNVEPEMTAKVNVTISVSREFSLVCGNFVPSQLQPESHLAFLCQSAALHRTPISSSIQVYIATHSVVNTRDSTKYTVQVVHSANMLLSLILVYDREQRLLSMAHLIGPDSLPSGDQLDNNLFLPHLSSPDERAFVIVNKDGDYGIVKGLWTGFSRKQPAFNGQNPEHGYPGVLLVNAFNLLENIVQEFKVTTGRSTLFVIGDTQAHLSEKRIECRSTNTAEQIASVFCVGTLFVLCNPDKVRTRSESTIVGHQAHKWPLTLACGYGCQEAPTNRLIHKDNGYDAASCGACAACVSRESCNTCGCG